MASPLLLDRSSIGKTMRSAANKLPIDVATSHTVGFVQRVAGLSGSRILEVGCGDGEVASRLAAAGHRILGLDTSSSAARATRRLGVEVIEGDFLGSGLALQNGFFDVVLFTRSLHHIHDLSAAVERAAQLVNDSGLLVCEDFDLDCIDEATANWFYDCRQRLLPQESGELSDALSSAPVERWHEEHHHEPALHGGSAMLDASRRHFELAELERVPYLYRYLCMRLPANEEGAALGAKLFAEESRRIARSELLAVGLRWLGRLRATPATARSTQESA